MSLLDGRYEVIAQRTLDDGLTLFEATAPDGAPLRIEWFDLAADQEGAFEDYRRQLRQLKRAGFAAVHDVIARPGAHYVAWERPPAGAAPVSDGAGALPPDLAEALMSAGYGLQSCDVRRLSTRPPKVMLYGLTFGARQSVERDDSRPLRHEEATQRERPLRQHQPPLQRGAEYIGRLPQRALSWGLAVLVSLIAVAMTLAGFWSARVDTVVTVPPVLGQDAQAAARSLIELGLGVNATPLMSDEAPGTVIKVEPAVGTNLRPGRTVELRYALPPGELAPTAVPALVGLSYPEEVRAALEGAGLRLGEVARLHAASPAGVVLAQDLDAGSQTGTGNPVAVLVSLGPRPVQTFVPDLVGLDLDSATAIALVAGITPDRVFADEIVSATGARGTVINQSLAPYVAVPRDAAVLRLVIQSGEPANPVTSGGAPDVVGLPLARAREVAAGWDLQVVALGNPGLPAGVVAQEPQPGAGAAGAGATLVLTVNAHPVPLTTDGVKAVVRQPSLRSVAYAWTIQPGIRTQQGAVWASDLEGNRQLVRTVTVKGGEVLRGTWTTVTAGPVTFELLIGGVPYGEPLLVP
jgi:beta-lactam-binding protein with PASTA domain